MKKEQKNLTIENFIEDEFIKRFLSGKTRAILDERIKISDSELKKLIKTLYSMNKKEIHKGFSFILKKTEKHGIEYPYFDVTSHSEPFFEDDKFVLHLDISNGKYHEHIDIVFRNPVATLDKHNIYRVMGIPVMEILTISKSMFQAFWHKALLQQAKKHKIEKDRIEKEKEKVSKEVKTLESQVNTLEKDIKSLKESSYPVNIKTPVNTFNVMLTDSNKTLSKINKAVKKLENYEKTVKDPKEKKIIQTQIEKGNEMFMKAKQNFPENFEFTVYEQYAIYGAFKLLTNNGYSPVRMYFSDILKALGFVKEDGKSVNKSEVTKIREAFKKLTEQKFPCYIAKETAPNKFTFYDNDEPLFKLKEVNTLDLNIQLSDKEITKKSLILSLENMQLIQDLQQFHTFINSNILRNLRLYKNQVQEKDLYFLAYLIKEQFCKQKDLNPKSTISLIKLAKILKLPDSNFIDKNTWKDRQNKHRFIKNIKTLSVFMVEENILKYDPDFSKDLESVVFYYAQYKEKKGSSQKSLKSNLVT